MSGDKFLTFLFNTLAVLLIVQQLEDGILAPGLCIFGDNAYLNTRTIHGNTSLSGCVRWDTRFV